MAKKAKQQEDPTRDQVLREWRPPTRLVSYGLRDQRLDQRVGYTIVSHAEIAKRRAANRVARASRKANRA